jgi:hypothetical protein
LVRGPGQKPEDYPHDILDLLEGIYKFAADGRLVDVGDVTLFGDTGFMQRDIRGIGYVAPENLPRVDMPSPALAGILLKGDEAVIAWNLTLTRVTALMGKSYRYYPYPFWSDLQRTPVGSPKDMDTSLIKKLPWVLRLSLSVRRAQLLKLAAIGASPLKLRVDLPANQERQPGDVQPRQ